MGWGCGDGKARLRTGRRFLTSLELVVLAAGSFVIAGAGPASASNTKPILECVFHDTKTGQYNSLWGYWNNSSSVENIPVGSNNNFSPSPQGRGQPTAFQPGTHDNVFSVTWNGSGSLTWTIDNHSDTASTGSKQCATNPVPILGPQSILWIAVILASAGFVVLRRRRRLTRSLI